MPVEYTYHKLWIDSRKKVVFNRTLSSSYSLLAEICIAIHFHAFTSLKYENLLKATRDVRLAIGEKVNNI